MASQGYYSGDPNMQGGYPPQPHGYPQQQPPGPYGMYPPGQVPQMQYQQAPPPEEKKDRGCLAGCLATLCCCWLCGETCECCLDCFDCCC